METRYIFVTGGVASSLGKGIISSSLAPQNICITQILRSGGGKRDLKLFYDELNGESDTNEIMAEMTIENSKALPFMNNF